MKRFARRAFTLIELLIVVAIIAVLAGVALPIFNSVQLNARRTQSLSNMRQFGVALLGYCGDNTGQLPAQGDKAPTWTGAAANTPAENSAWYNVLPRNYGNTKGLGDFVNAPGDFYGKGSLFFVPAAKYPATKLGAPLFAIAYCSKLIDKTYDDGDATTVRIQNFQSPANTCVFQESGVTGETPIRGQSAYNTDGANNQPYSYASRTAARYGGQTIIVFADGHAGLVTGTDIVARTASPIFRRLARPPRRTGIYPPCRGLLTRARMRPSKALLKTLGVDEAPVVIETQRDDPVVFLARPVAAGQEFIGSRAKRG